MVWTRDIPSHIHNLYICYVKMLAIKTENMQLPEKCTLKVFILHISLWSGNHTAFSRK